MRGIGTFDDDNCGALPPSRLLLCRTKQICLICACSFFFFFFYMQSILILTHRDGEEMESGVLGRTLRAVVSQGSKESIC